MTVSPSGRSVPAGTIQILPVDGIPEVREGDPVTTMIADAIGESIGALEPGDVVAVTHKIVSKAEGRLIDLSTISPSELAERYAREWDKDARQVEVVLQQSKRIVRMVRGLIIAETRHGFICANAGVDASNVVNGVVCALPEDPDASAEAIRQELVARYFGGWEDERSPIGVVVTDSFGRPWRSGIVNVAVGVAGIAPLADYRGQYDPAGYELRASILAVADELASAAELVMHKLAARPVAIVRGYEAQTGDYLGTGRDLVMPEERNLFI
jgi:coenzyme F420-0:L-glutamate ligase / coenzyme F420-1:gamma-L-glutamate ligase